MSVKRTGWMKRWMSRDGCGSDRGQEAAGKLGRVWLLCAVLGAVVMLSACSSGQDAMRAQMMELDQRLKEVERTQGRRAVRVEDMQDQINLLADRVETNRLAMERRGTARSLPLVRVGPNGNSQTGMSSPPPYTPPSYPSAQAYPGPQYGGYAAPAPPPPTLPQAAAPITARIAVPQPAREARAAEAARAPQPAAAPAETGPVERITITEDDYRRVVEEAGDVYSPPDSGSSSRRSRPSSSGRASRSVPRSKATGAGGKTPVTQEMLPVTAQVPAGAASAVALNPAPAKSAAPVVSPSDSPMDVYKKALASYRSGEYGQAFNQFKAYLDMGPSRDYLDNAYYWLGECSFGLGKHEQAITYFNRVIKETPGGNKVPDSMLKAALAYKRLGKTSEAKSTLYNLLETYPNTNAAKLATDKLKTLE